MSSLLQFSKDPEIADRQLGAITFYLLAFGYADGDLDPREQEFVRQYVTDLTRWRVASAGIVDAEERRLLRERCSEEYQRVHRTTALLARRLESEAVAQGEDVRDVVGTRLTLQCYDMFRRFDEATQRQLLAAGEALIEADGKVHPAEVVLRDELRALLAAPPGLQPGDGIPDAAGAALEILDEVRLPVPVGDAGLFSRIEATLAERPTDGPCSDFGLMKRAMEQLREAREHGRGNLAGKLRLDDVLLDGPFLDGGVHVLPPPKSGSRELIVLGDLHGCYSCLKAAVLQSGFLEKVAAHRANPDYAPDVRLVLLGDYIDRGRFGFDGVLRAALSLFLEHPDHVYLLRGNHEQFYERPGGVVLPSVFPADSLEQVKQVWRPEEIVLAGRLFEQLPHVLLHGRILFVHGGIPRETTVEKWVDLSSLNDERARMEMLWADPSRAGYVPHRLQAKTARFPFGVLQFRRFMGLLGARAMIRGHEQVASGVETAIDSAGLRLVTVFSAGGETNTDLPVTSTYRQVTPKALTIVCRNGENKATPWAIDYEPFLYPARNGFYRR